MWRSLFTASLLLFAVSGGLFAKLEVKNLFSGRAYLDLEESDPWQQCELLWQPEMYARVGNEDGLTFTGDISLQNKLDLIVEPVDLKPEVYRLWGSASFGGTDLRVGLQKLNFGTARIIRPEQWFDELRALDPLEETNGVRAAVLKQYFSYRSGIWLWGVLTKNPFSGLEFRDDDPDNTNLGGRIEFPLPGVETGVSFNAIDLSAESGLKAKEYQLGFDLRYDGKFGAWIEGSGTKNDGYPIWSSTGYQTSLTLGTDYTIGLGNGIYLLQETNVTHSTLSGLPDLKHVLTQTALLISYPPGLLDNLQFLILYDYDSNLNISLLWQRSYDYWSWELGLNQSFIRGESRKPGLSFRLNYNI